MDSSQLADYSQIVKVFEKALLAAPSEEAVIGSILPKVASISVNANSASSNLHDASGPEFPGPVMALFSATEGGVQLPSILPNNGAIRAASDPLDVNKWRDWLEKCIPCDLRISLRAELFGTIDDVLLSTLEAMVNNFLKELAFIMNLLNAPDVYQDACLMLKALDDVCVPDLQRMLSLLAAMLYRLTAKEIQGLDLMKLIVLPIFQPIFIGIATLFGQWKSLVINPLECVVTNLNFQLEKIKTGDFLNDRHIDRIDEVNNDVLGASNNERAELRTNLKNTQKLFDDIDEGIEFIQNSAGTASFLLRNMLTRGIREAESLLNDILGEIAKFVGVNDRETVDFLLKQYEKIMIIRMIGFIAALVKALISGFNCDLSSPDIAQHTLAEFFDNFLGDAPIIVQVDPDTQDIKLFLDNEIFESVGEIPVSNRALQAPVVIDPTGDAEVDAAINAIIDQAANPVKVKPPCLFEAAVDSNNKLSEWIKQLDSIEV